MVRYEVALWGWLATVLLLSYSVAAFTTTERCTACRDMTTAFRKGLDASRRSNFGGGNTAWEESRLGAWAFSETRLVGVMEGVCKKATKPAICSSLVEEHEEDVEEWWNKIFRADPKQADLFQFLCIERLKVCCPDLHFGDKCAPCPGIVLKKPDDAKSEKTPCNGHGTCEGTGDRSGSGLCTCDTGYEGDDCNMCADDHFNASTAPNASAVMCKECHKACSGGCTGPGPEHCSAGCQSGWDYQEGRGCLDVNECSNATVCMGGQFCVNEAGSFRCDTCDPACANCTGPSAENCTTCATGYRRGSALPPAALGTCEDVNECLEGGCPEGKVCTNSPGSFTCSCPENQEENAEGKCVPKAPEEPKTQPSDEQSSHQEL